MPSFLARCARPRTTFRAHANIAVSTIRRGNECGAGRYIAVRSVLACVFDLLCLEFGELLRGEDLAGSGDGDFLGAATRREEGFVGGCMQEKVPHTSVAEDVFARSFDCGGLGEGVEAG